ncbi:hypothetical protein [Deinococcus sp. UYEF24]
MFIKDQAVRLTSVMVRLEDCINAIMVTGDLKRWMSPDGIALLNGTLKSFEGHRLVLERPGSALNDPTYVGHQARETQIKNYEHLLVHLTGTLKLARDRQELPATELPEPPTN